MHYLTGGRSSTYLCGANALGRRNTRTDCDENQTTCPRCLATPTTPASKPSWTFPPPARSSLANNQN